MAKLGYALTLAGLKKATSIYNSTNGVGNSIYITGDGYLVTKTDEFKLLLNWDSISNNTLIIKDNSGNFTSTDVPTIDGQVLKWDSTNNKFIWGTDNNNKYKLLINGGTAAGDSDGTSLGSFYAPTSVGTGGLPAWESNSWNWYTILSSITDSNSGIPTAAAIRNYVGTEVGTATARLTGAMHYRGTTTITESSSKITVTAIEGITFGSGDVVVANTASTKPSAEYVYDGTNWREIGDEGSYLLKTSKPLSSTNSTISIGTGDIGTGITLDLVSITQNNSTPTGTLTYAGTFTAVTGVTRDNYGRVTGVATTTYTMPSTDEIDYSSALYWASNTTKATANPNSATNNPYLQLIQNDALKTSVKFAGSDYLGVSANGDTITFTNNGIKTLSYTDNNNSSNSYAYTIGTLKINGTDTIIYGKDTNTWRPVYAWKYNDLGKTGDTLDKLIEYGGTGVAGLAFNSTFGYSEQTVDGVKYAEIGLVWAEVDNDGNVAYTI